MKIKVAIAILFGIICAQDTTTGSTETQDQLAQDTAGAKKDETYTVKNQIESLLEIVKVIKGGDRHTILDSINTRMMDLKDYRSPETVGAIEAEILSMGKIMKNLQENNIVAALEELETRKELLLE